MAIEAAKSPEQRAFEAEESARIAKEHAEAQQKASEQKRTSEEVSFFFWKERLLLSFCSPIACVRFSLSLCLSVSLSLSLCLALSLSLLLLPFCP